MIYISSRSIFLYVNISASIRFPIFSGLEFVKYDINTCTYNILILSKFDFMYICITKITLNIQIAALHI